jgi:hypothetical protein
MSFKFNNPDDQKRFDELFFECGSENLACAKLQYEKLSNNPDSSDAAKNAALIVIQKIEKGLEQTQQRDGAMILKTELNSVYQAVAIATGLAMGDLLFDKFDGWLDIHNQIEDKSQAIYKAIIDKADDPQQIRRMIQELEQQRAEKNIKLENYLEEKRRENQNRSAGYNHHRTNLEKLKIKVDAVVTSDLKEAGHSTVSRAMLDYVISEMYSKHEDENE